VDGGQSRPVSPFDLEARMRNKGVANLLPEVAKTFCGVISLQNFLLSVYRTLVERRDRGRDTASKTRK